MSEFNLRLKMITESLFLTSSDELFHYLMEDVKKKELKYCSRVYSLNIMCIAQTES